MNHRQVWLLAASLVGALVGSLWGCDAAPPAAPDTPACPAMMARIKGADHDFCIHRYEVRAVGDLGPHDQGASWPVTSARRVSITAAAGQLPTKGVSWYQAAAACRAMGWSLCTSQQWEDTCDGQPGPGGRAHPTPNGELERATCNINHPGTGSLKPSGSFADCHTPQGVYDLEGNLWEWTDPQQTDAQGLPLIDKRGGGHYSGAVCPCTQSAVGTHAPSFDGTIGFRCCTPAG